MIHIAEELLNQEPSDTLATPDFLSDTKSILGSTLLLDKKFFPDKEKGDVSEIHSHEIKDISTSFVPLPDKNKVRTYNPSLDAAREHLPQDDAFYTSADINYIIDIIQRHRASLGFDDFVELYFKLIHIRLADKNEKNIANIDGTLAFLDKFLPYEHQFSFEQQSLFWYYMGSACFAKAFMTTNSIYHQRANDAFDKLLKMNSNDMKHNTITNSFLDTGMYKEVMYLKISSLFALHEYENNLIAIANFLDACGRNPLKKTYDDVSPDRISRVLFIQGDAYESLNNHEKAIECYQQYLLLTPDDEYVKKNIEFLKTNQSSE